MLTKTGANVGNIIKRVNISAFDLQKHLNLFKDLPTAVVNQINIQTKYEGYIDRQLEQIKSAKKQENIKLPHDFDYNQIKGLRIEARQKLNKIKPDSIGQASRISGVSPADINVLLVYLKTKN
jgi:tRNA uridine 5-carboxymethylaminomethyl modification enzyme